MSWRIVVISNIAKLDFKLGSMVIRSESVTRIHLSEISMLIIENTAVSLTAALLCELVKQKIKVIFCDEHRLPQSELLPYYGSHDTSAKIRAQISWNEETKNTVWTEIVRNKISQQYNLLKSIQSDMASLLFQYMEELEYNDISNREGHSAKVYFNSLFGLSFTRSESSAINGALNYGYSILLSAFSREIVANGYITQLGIHHNNVFNPYNLSSDLMEPFRPLVDSIVYNLMPSVFESKDKLLLVDVLNKGVTIDTQTQYVNNAIKIYCKSVFNALNDKDLSQLRFYTHEL